MGELEASGGVGAGPRERPPPVTEELALPDLNGDGRAVHLHERPIGSGALLVDAPREELLSRPRLAPEEDRRRRRGRRVHHLEGAPPRGAFPEDADRRSPGSAKVLDLALQGLALDCPLESHLEGVGVGGLHEVVAGTGPEAGDGRADRALAGEDDEGQVGGEGPCLLHELEPVPVAKAQVREHDVRARASEEGDRLRDAARLEHLVSTLVEDRGEGGPDVRLVLDNQDPAAIVLRHQAASVRGGVGSVIKSTVPPPSRGTASRFPPCCLTIE